MTGVIDLRSNCVELFRGDEAENLPSFRDAYRRNNAPVRDIYFRFASHEFNHAPARIDVITQRVAPSGIAEMLMENFGRKIQPVRAIQNYEPAHNCSEVRTTIDPITAGEVHIEHVIHAEGSRTPIDVHQQEGN